MKSTSVFRFLPALALLLLLSGAAWAQPDTGGPQPGSPNNTVSVPVDGGASLLLASGLAYGLARLRKRRHRA